METNLKIVSKFENSLWKLWIRFEFFLYFDSSETSMTMMSRCGAHRAESIKLNMPWRQSSRDPPPSVWRARHMLQLWLWNEQLLSCLLTRKRSFLLIHTWVWQLLVWQLMPVSSAATWELSASIIAILTMNLCPSPDSLVTWATNFKSVLNATTAVHTELVFLLLATM